MIKKLRLFVSILALLSIVVAATPAYADCGGTKTQIVSCGSQGGTASINDLISITVIVMTVIIGIVAVGGIAYAAILYASARDNQNQVNEAMTIIRNIVIGILLYGFTIVIINWLIPGGVIG
jgi:heme/copper-type cytochrome/quinol oxidase subunit 2